MEGKKYAKTIKAAIDLCSNWWQQIKLGGNAVLPFCVTLPPYQTTVASALMRRN